MDQDAVDWSTSVAGPPPRPGGRRPSAARSCGASEAWPEVDEESRGLAVEVVVRLTVSHIVQPVAPPEESARRIAAITERIAYPGGGA
ncbi:hypothetical protein ACIOMM_31770 [Streptomyces sp. NPDC087908]|uniref:hypothetical protein n=1 Tax=unclassified Streptomyces TaxID=2593676 RepID=UPI002905BA84|nr:hypothetical protein [Streptomyces sp. adm13(2018)]